jgi:hypothetical protein
VYFPLSFYLPFPSSVFSLIFTAYPFVFLSHLPFSLWSSMLILSFSYFIRCLLCVCISMFGVFLFV